jgi:hypothetical protein
MKPLAIVARETKPDVRRKSDEREDSGLPSLLRRPLAIVARATIQ